LSLHFGSPSGTGFAPGQLWEVEVYAGGVSLARAPSTVEFEACSGRGQCNLGTGLCTCFDGFMGATCETRTDVKLIRDGDPGFLVAVEDALFTGDVLRLTSDKLPPTFTSSRRSRAASACLACAAMAPWRCRCLA